MATASDHPRSSRKGRAPAELSFEDAIDQLESIIEKIESGEVGLEECLAYYEQGTKLARHCGTILTRAQQRIAELTPDAQGVLQVKDDEVEVEASPESAELPPGPHTHVDE